MPNKFFHVLGVNVIAVLLLPSCNPPVITDLMHVPTPQGPLEMSDKPLVFFVLSKDTQNKGVDFGSLEMMKKWSDDSAVHGFIHSKSKGYCDEAEKFATTHCVDEKQIFPTMTNIIAQNKNLKHMVIFIEAHGYVGTGNICYLSSDACSGTHINADQLFSFFDGLGQIQNNLEYILIIPLSCHNRIITNKVKKLAENSNFPFALSFLPQTDEGICMGGVDFNYQLRRKELTYYFSIPSGETVDAYFATNTLEELIAFAKTKWQGEYKQSEIVNVGKKMLSPISLSKLGLTNLQVKIDMTVEYKDLKTLTTVGEVFENLDIVKGQRHRITKLEFSDCWEDDLSIPIHGDMTTPMKWPKDDNCYWTISLSIDGK